MCVCFKNCGLMTAGLVWVMKILDNKEESHFLSWGLEDAVLETRSNAEFLLLLELKNNQFLTCICI